MSPSALRWPKYDDIFNSCQPSEYGPTCPDPPWTNPNHEVYNYGQLVWLGHSYVPTTYSLNANGSCVRHTDEFCGSAEIPNHFHGAIGGCVRSADCPPGSWWYSTSTPCKTRKSEVCPAGNPVDCVNGVKYHVVQDIAPLQDGLLGFTRYYSSSGFYAPASHGVSLADVGVEPVVLGEHWRHTYQRSVMREPVATGVPEMVTVSSPDGDYAHFQLVDGVWKGRSDKLGRLEELTNNGAHVGWRYLAPDNSVEVFDEDGRLSTWSLATGASLEFAYSDSATDPAVAPIDGLLTEVEHSTGRRLTFFYDELARLVRVVGPGGDQYEYDYSSSSRLYPRLSSVARPAPDGVTVVESYLYNEPAYNANHFGGAQLLTGIVGSDGVRYATYKYSHNKVQDEWHGSSYANRLQMTYYPSGSNHANGFSRMTFALNRFEQRDLVLVNGVIKERGRKRCATQNCSVVLTETKTTYRSSDGNVDTVTDGGGTDLPHF